MKMLMKLNQSPQIKNFWLAQIESELNCPKFA